MALPSETLPFSVYTVALTACTAQQELAPSGYLDPHGHCHARAKNGLCSIHKSRSSSFQNQLSCTLKHAGVQTEQLDLS